MFRTILIIVLYNYLNTLEKTKINEELNHSAESIKLRLGFVLKNRMFISNSLESLFQVNPDCTEKEFEAFARTLLLWNDPVRALQFADNSTQVKYVYPPKNNEITITEPLVLIDDPLRGQYVKKAISEKRTTIQPPFELRQGGLE